MENKRKDNMESCEKKRVSRFSSFGDDDFILLVGEGDFSFAAFLIQHTKAHIVATTLLSSSHILTKRQKNNISLIENCGGIVYTDVDATHLISHLEVKKNPYKVIIFNFPHIPGKMKINANRDLLRNFFISAKKVLISGGEVHVTLCKGQGGTAADVCHREWQNTWMITAMAAVSDFVLVHVEPFHVEDYPCYTCSGYRGLEKSFHIDGALTHVFKLGYPIMRTLETVFNSQWCNNIMDKQHPLISTHIRICNKYKSLFETCEHPVAKTHLLLTDEIRKYSTISQVISFPELQVCPGKICFRHWQKQSSVKGGLPCSLSSLLSSVTSIFQNVEQQLKKGIDVIIISSHVCCPHNFTADDLPLSSNALFLGRSMSVVIDKLCMVLNKFLGKQSSSNITDSNYLYAYDLQPNSCNYQKMHFESLQGHEDLAHSSYTFQKETEVNFEDIGTVLASYNILQSCSHALYQDVCVTISDKNIKGQNDVGTHKEFLKLGNVYAVTYKQRIMFCTSLAIEYVSMAKFHIFNYQILLSNMSYYAAHVHDGASHVIYRSPSLFPPFYVHDSSFWLSKGFEENQLLLLVKIVAGDLIQNVKLIDTYCEQSSQKKSHCYRFMYQSCDRPLSKDGARDIDANLIRYCIEQYLHVKLR